VKRLRYPSSCAGISRNILWVLRVRSAVELPTEGSFQTGPPRNDSQDPNHSGSHRLDRRRGLLSSEPFVDGSVSVWDLLLMVETVLGWPKLNWHPVAAYQPMETIRRDHPAFRRPIVTVCWLCTPRSSGTQGSLRPGNFKRNAWLGPSRHIFRLTESASTYFKFDAGHFRRLRSPRSEGGMIPRKRL
jgi:hypothetical protein